MKNIYIFLSLFVLTFTACTTDIDLKLEGTEPMLVVDGCVTTDTMAHGIFLQKSSDYFANQPVSGISGAQVTISDGVQTVSLTESASRPGLYETPNTYYGLPGKTYTLHMSGLDVNGDGVNEVYEATSTLKDVPDMDEVVVEETKLFGMKMWAFKASFQDPAETRNNYLFRDYLNGRCVSDTINECGITNDEFFNGVYLKDEPIMYFASQKTDENVAVGDTCTLEICGITDDYLYFINDVVSELYGRNPMFGGQPANIRTNIHQLSPVVKSSNSPRGYFATYAVKRKSVVYDGR